MLKQRILTAAVLMPLVAAAVLLLSTPHFALFTGAMLLLAGWEWSNLMGWQRLSVRGLYPLLLASLMAVTWVFAGSIELLIALIGASLVWWLLLSWLLLGRTSLPERFPAKGWAGVITLLPAWLALSILHATSPWWVLYLLGITIAADSGAYFAGRRWGRQKLAPQISPGKTREGVVGGLAATAVYALLVAAAIGMTTRDLLLLTLVSVVTALFSVVGDLFESLLKRERGIKDSGALLPGHGGVLDRIDSLLAAVPLFWAGWVAFEWSR
jgi:phosphatidate cytidylyltransferase